MLSTVIRIIAESLLSVSSTELNGFWVVSSTHFVCFVCHLCVGVRDFNVLTCWSTPTASRPSYIISTQPSFEAKTNRDIKAWERDKEKWWKRNTRVTWGKKWFNDQKYWSFSGLTCPKLSKLYLCLTHLKLACKQSDLLVMFPTSSPWQTKNFPLKSCIEKKPIIYFLP